MVIQRGNFFLITNIFLTTLKMNKYQPVQYLSKKNGKNRKKGIIIFTTFVMDLQFFRSLRILSTSIQNSSSTFIFLHISSFEILPSLIWTCQARVMFGYLPTFANSYIFKYGDLIPILITPIVDPDHPTCVTKIPPLWLLTMAPACARPVSPVMTPPGLSSPPSLAVPVTK